MPLCVYSPKIVQESNHINSRELLLRLLSLARKWRAPRLFSIADRKKMREREKRKETALKRKIPLHYFLPIHAGKS